jgi:hypothetical protein
MKPMITLLTPGILVLATALQADGAGGGTTCGNVPEKPSSGCTAQSAEIPQGGYRILAPSGKAVVPFEMSNDHILVPVRVDGSEPFHLVLDTGMPIPGVMLHPSPRTDALDLKNPGGLRLAIGGVEGPDPRVGTGVTLGLPGVELTEQIVGIVPLPGCVDPEMQALHAMSRTEGVIGLSIFQNFVVTIDYDRQMITLFEPGRYSYEGEGVEIPLNIGPMGVPEVSCEVEMRPRKPVPINVVVDTGATYALSLTIGTSDDICLPRGARECVVGYSNWGRVTGSLARVRSLRIGEAVLRDVLATFFQKGAPGVPPCGENGILGNEALSRFKTTFDYSRKRMILEPGRRVSEPFETDMCGMRYVADDAGALRVTQVFPDSPASEARICEGDLVTAVNGKRAGEYAPEELRRLLQTDGAKVRFRIERAGHGLDIKLRLRRMV